MIVIQQFNKRLSAYKIVIAAPFQLKLPSDLLRLSYSIFFFVANVVAIKYYPMHLRFINK